VERHDVATRRALVTAAMVLALAGVIAVLVTRVGRSYLPLGDEANIDLRVPCCSCSRRGRSPAARGGDSSPPPWSEASSSSCTWDTSHCS